MKIFQKQFFVVKREADVVARASLSHFYVITELTKLAYGSHIKNGIEIRKCVLVEIRTR